MAILKKVLYYLLITFGVLLVAVTLVSLSYNTSLWYLKVLNFPRLLTLLALTACLVMYGLWFRKRKRAWLFLGGLFVAIGIQLYYLANYVPFVNREVKSVEAEAVPPNSVVSVVVANVLMTNRNADDLLKMVREKDPTFFLAMEVNRWWTNQLSVLEEQYPHRMTFPADNTYGMVLYSKLPLEDQRVHFLSNDSVPAFLAKVVMPSGKRFNFLALHPVPPMPSEHPDNVGEKEVALLKAGRMVAGLSGPTLVAGDFNDVGWSHNTRRFVELSGLKDIRHGRGMYNTFTAETIFLRWPLDYVFVSSAFRVVDIDRLSKFGSDHFPYYAKLALLPDLSEEQLEELDDD